MKYSEMIELLKTKTDTGTTMVISALEQQEKDEIHVWIIVGFLMAGLVSFAVGLRL